MCPVEGQSKPRKQPYYVTGKDGMPFTFAGLWERWKDCMLSFTILTTEGTAATRHLHDRMPVILEEFGFFGWLEHGVVATRLVWTRRCICSQFRRR